MARQDPEIGDLWVLNPAPDDDSTPPHSPNDVCGTSDPHGLLEAAYTPQAWADLLVPIFKATDPVFVVAVAPEASAASLPLADRPPAESLPRWLGNHLPAPELELGAPIDVAAPAGVGGDYQLAPLLSGEGLQHGWVLLSGGERRCVGLLRQPQPLNLFPPDEAVVRAQKLFGTDDEPKVERLSWRPSLESSSPFLPFREVSFDDQRAAFVRLDRKVSTSLTSVARAG